MRAVNVGVGFYFYFEFLNQKMMAYSYEFFIRIKLVIFCTKVWDDDYWSRLNIQQQMLAVVNWLVTCFSNQLRRVHNFLIEIQNTMHHIAWLWGLRHKKIFIDKLCMSQFCLTNFFPSPIMLKYVIH